MLLFRRLLGVLLLAAGLALIAIGGWFATVLGSGGTARFTAQGVGTTPVVIGPSVLNRTALPVRVTVTPAAGSAATVVVGTPSDTAAIVGDAEIDAVTGVGVWDRSATLARRGTGGDLDVTTVDVWRSRQSVTGPTTVTITQDTAPETLVIAPAAGASLASVTLTWTHPAWFTEALVLIGAGIVLAVIALLVLRRRRPHSAAATPTPTTPAAAEVAS